MKKTILLFLITQLALSQNTPIEVISDLPYGLSAMDIHNNYVYFSTVDGEHVIGRVDYISPNSTYEIINSNVFTPFGLTIHENELFFSEVVLGRISKINLLDNSLQTEILNITWDSDGPWGLKVYDDELYFSESVANLKKVPLSNISQLPELVCSNIPHQFSFVKEENFIYTTAFADDLINNIYRVNLLNPIGSEPENLGEIFEPMSMVKMGNLIFVSTNDSKIYRIDLNNLTSGPELFYEVTDEVSFIGTLKDHNNELYFTFNKADFETKTISGKIMKFSQSQLSNSSFASFPNVKTFPNPAQNTLHINTQETIKEAAIYDMLGKKISTTQVNANAVDVSSIPTGLYLIKLIGKTGKTFSSKFVKE